MKGSDLAAHPFLHGLRREQLDALAGIAMRMSIGASKTLFRERERANRFYLLLTGKVELSLSSPDGERPLDRKIGGGEVLGWPWSLPDYEWPFSATVTEETKVICFFGSMLRAECERDRELGNELMRRVTVTLRWLEATPS